MWSPFFGGAIPTYSVLPYTMIYQSLPQSKTTQRDEKHLNSGRWTNVIDTSMMITVKKNSHTSLLFQIQVSEHNLKFISYFVEESYMTFFSPFSANFPPHYHTILAINCVHASNWFTHLQQIWQIDGQNDNSVLKCVWSSWSINKPTIFKKVCLEWPTQTLLNLIRLDGFTVMEDYNFKSPHYQRRYDKVTWS